MLLRERDVLANWRDRLAAIFDARVRGPVFEEQARAWARRHAAPGTLGEPEHPIIGPSTVVVDGTERQLDLVVASALDPGAPPGERAVHALGEAKAGRTVGTNELRMMERARAALGTRAAHARLLLIAPAFTDEVRALAANRDDVDLVDLDRLYHGS